MGAMEEGGQTVRTLITNMKDSPITLGLMVINLAFLVYLFSAEHSATELRRELTGLFLKQQGETASLLAKCIDPTVLERLLKDRDDKSGDTP